MVNSRELRIGNYIRCIVHLPIGYNTPKISFSSILEIRCNSVDTNDGFYKYREIAPIFLTEEILIKCGGNKTTNNEYVLSDVDSSVPSVYIIMEEDKFYLGTPDGKKYSTPIESLHHLQNIYYYITGKELQINLNNK